MARSLTNVIGDAVQYVIKRGVQGAFPKSIALGKRVSEEDRKKSQKKDGEEVKKTVAGIASRTPKHVGPVYDEEKITSKKKVVSKKKPVHKTVAKEDKEPGGHIYLPEGKVNYPTTKQPKVVLAKKKAKHRRVASGAGQGTRKLSRYKGNSKQYAKREANQGKRVYV